jgi:hypothetical protein
MGCPVCLHPLATEIDANVAHLSLRQLEARYAVSRSSLQRHQQRCQQPSQVPGDTEEAARAPAPASNPLAAYHGTAQQQHAALSDYTHPIDVRGALTALCGLLVQLTAPGESR